MEEGHIGRESLFWPFAAVVTSVYKAALSKGFTPTQLTALFHNRRHSKEIIKDAGLEELLKIADLPPVTIPTPDQDLVQLERLMIEELFCSPFVYRPLEHPNHIRVLILHPGHPSEPLRGTIRHQPYSRVCYEAISYTWGDDATPCSMLLDGCQMPLTQSLFNALVRLRRPERDRILWADGVCIAQADNKEKSMQISLMPEIFKQAKVLVYLGKEADGSELVPDLLDRLHEHDFTRISKRSLFSNGLESYGLPPQNDKAWFSLLHFLGRPWFIRVWVVQEVVLSREVRFLCGEWDLGWKKVSHMANYAEKVLRVALPNDSEDMQCDAAVAAASLALMLGLRITRSAVSKRLEEIEEGVERSRQISSNGTEVGEAIATCATSRDYVINSCLQHPEIYDCIERVVVGLPDGVDPSRTPITMLLSMFMRNKVTKYQDRLYALVGLSMDITLDEFPSDYDESVEQTNLRVGRLLVKKGQGMDLLYHATKWSFELWNPALPSWASDWTRRRSQSDHWLKLGWAYHGGWECKFAASPRAVSLVDNDPRVLRVAGFRLDLCQGTIVQFLDPFNLGDPMARLQRFFKQSDHVFSGEPYFTGEAWAEVACRTLIADHIPQKFKEQPMSALIADFEDAKARSTNPAKKRRSEDPTNAWGGVMINLMYGSALCKTSSGYVGLVSEATAPTDEIFMFEGSDLPFVLRPSLIRPGYYHFLGGCYIHGLMAGKAWKREHTLSEILLI